MMKHEFEACLRELGQMNVMVRDEDYKLIEYVYTWHPCISNTKGKAQVAWLFNEFGIRIFKDMKQTADRNFELEETIERSRSQLRKLLDEADELRKGGQG